MHYVTNMVEFQLQKIAYNFNIIIAGFLLIISLKSDRYHPFFCFDYHDSRRFFSITSLTERSEALFKELLIFHCDNLELIRRSRFIIQS